MSSAGPSCAPQPQKGALPSLDRGGGQKGHHLWLPKSSRLGRAKSPEGPAAGSGPRVPTPAPAGAGCSACLYPSPQTPLPLVCNGISTLLLNPHLRSWRPCFSSVCGTSAPSPPMTIVRFVSGVGNLLGFFPTIMALSVPVFSVFSTCEIDVYGKKRKKKKNLTYCIKITILCAPRATAFGSGLPTPSPTPLGLPSGGESVHTCGSLVC